MVELVDRRVLGALQLQGLLDPIRGMVDEILGMLPNVFAAKLEPIGKLSDMDLEEHRLYVRYSRAKDTTFQYTDIKQAPWYVVPSDCKRRARLNCIGHMLKMIPFEDIVPDPVDIPERGGSVEGDDQVRIGPR